MRYGAVVTNAVVVNVVVLDDQDDLGIVAAVHGADSVVDVTEMEPRPGPSWTVHGDELRPPSPYASWVWSEGAWTSPVPMPDDESPHAWDEETQTWIVAE